MFFFKSIKDIFSGKSCLFFNKAYIFLGIMFFFDKGYFFWNHVFLLHKGFFWGIMFFFKVGGDFIMLFFSPDSFSRLGVLTSNRKGGGVGTNFGGLYEGGGGVLYLFFSVFFGEKGINTQMLMLMLVG